MTLDSITGCLIGTAIGDAVGLPAEGCKRRTIDRRFPRPWRHCLLGRWVNWGMCSDDTEHSFFVAQALLASHGDVKRFRQSLAWKLRWWFIALPAGVGMATARSCMRLWLGWPSDKSGVWSAGNGPVMRAAILGVVFADDPEARHAHISASTQITHHDPKANAVAKAVADLAAAWARGHYTLADNMRTLRAVSDNIDNRDNSDNSDNSEWQDLLNLVQAGLAEQIDARSMADRLGLERGISGYVYHTGPMVFFCALRYGDDPREALERIWDCGGDTDTTGAILGGLLGARHGDKAFPFDWINGIHNGPLSMSVIRKTAAALQHKDTAKPVRWCWPLVPIRNPLFLIIVLGHGLRRLLP